MELFGVNKYNHTDKEIGLLRRVSGYWRVENPDIEIDVTIKIEGSDRFGPDRNALKSYKSYRYRIPELWEEVKKLIVAELKTKDIGWDAESSVFHLSEILVFNPKKSEGDIVYAFNIEQDNYSMYSAITKEGHAHSYERATYG